MTDTADFAKFALAHFVKSTSAHNSAIYTDDNITHNSQSRLTMLALSY